VAAETQALTEEPPPLRVIEPTRGLRLIDLRELWRYRELLFFLTWRTILVRYKQTFLGVAWAIIQPFFLMVVFSIFFVRLGKLSHGGIPAPIFLYSGLVVWTFFATAVISSANSLVGSASLVTKVYFPRVAIPLAAVFAALVDFAVAMLLLFAMMGWYGFYPRPIAAIVLPALILLAMASALGVGLWLSALNVAYRDVQYVVGFLVQALLFMTPAIYQSGTFGEPWHTLLGLNPMQGVVSGFRWALLGTGAGPGAQIWVSVGVTVTLLVTGTVFFRRVERTFADVV
jgi:lipopolysaccharide transport system permease protein